MTSRTFATIVLALILFGCGNADDDGGAIATPSAEEPAIETEDITVYFPRMADEAAYGFVDDRRAERLTLDDQGCLRFGDEGPLIIWPDESFSVELIDDEVTVTHGNGEPLLHVGETISLVGGAASADMLDRDGFVLDVWPPDECLEDSGILVPSDEVEAAD